MMPRMIICFLTLLETFLTCLVNGCSRECSRYQTDCDDFKSLGHTHSGIFHVIPEKTNRGYDVYCDMETDGGGWLVIQRRIDGSVDFYRGWDEYERGFGNVSTEYWLGIIPLKRILSQGEYELRIDLDDWAGETRYATYNVFHVGESEDKYKLKAISYSGDAGDALKKHNGMKFTTWDRDNDVKDAYNCGRNLKGAWWHYGCGDVNLNGKYYNENGTEHSDGIYWQQWFRNGQSNSYTLKRTEMKIRKV